MKKFTPLVTIFITICLLLSCNKQDEFLNKKRNLSDVVPTTISDFQAMMDNNTKMNNGLSSIGYNGCDQFLLSDNNISRVGQVAAAAYVWKKDIYQGILVGYNTDWDNPYASIEQANIALDGLSNIKTIDNQIAYNNAKGSALFFRALSLYSLSQVYCKAYDSSSAANDLGLVVRTTSDVNVPSSRASVKDTYSQMISDLTQSITLLPALPNFPMRPSQCSANALLAKIYLSAGDYQDALLYINAALGFFNTVLDFNSPVISITRSAPFPPYPKNPEIVFYAQAIGLGTQVAGANFNIATIDTAFYNMYDSNDLRKSLYFKDQGSGKITFRGSYTGTFYNFAGIATNEMLLIRAECNARIGKGTDALNDINTLLQKRFKQGTFVKYSVTDPNTLLSLILRERLKELAFTGQLRWEDLRRLNKDPRFAKTLTRISNGATYTLPANDPRYTLPIPDNEIRLSGIPQNAR